MSEATCKVCGKPEHLLPGSCAVELATENAQLRRELAEAIKVRDEIETSRCGESYSTDRVAALHDQIKALQAERNEFADLVAQIPHEKEFERREFIREATTALAAALFASGRLELIEPVAIWVLAKALWDAKPEDC